MPWPVGSGDWVITGGESAHLMSPRKYFLAWPRLLVPQCRVLGLSLFVKQIGSLAFDGERRNYIKHPAGADPNEWPADLRVQQWPRVFENEERSVSQPTFL